MRRLPLVLVLAALWACPGKPNYPECKSDDDCRDHAQICEQGFCRECRDDSQCKDKPERPACVNNACAAKSQCAKNEDCPAGQKCAAQKCVPECSEATAAQDCGEGRRCVAGRCAAEEQCAADADCGQGKACVNQRCQAQGNADAARAGRSFGKCALEPVSFGYDDSTLSPEARRTLSELWTCLSGETFSRIVVAGHTDERGTTEYNVALGMRRADAVKRYLAGLGAAAAKLKAVSYGKERPADPGHDDASWARNRRVELAPEK